MFFIKFVCVYVHVRVLLLLFYETDTHFNAFLEFPRR